jgi:hypothetical protein
MAELTWVLSDEALTDLTSIALWYEEQRLYLSDEFLKEFYMVSLETIAQTMKLLENSAEAAASGDIR